MDEKSIKFETWQIVDCDAEILTKMVKHYGGDKLRVEELWNMDLKKINEFRSVHGFMLFYKWNPPDNLEPNPPFASDEKTANIYFASQVIDEGCITQAVLSILLNRPHPDIKWSDTVAKFYKLTAKLPPALKGLALSNNAGIRSIHNSLSNCYFNGKPDSLNPDSVYHYSTYFAIKNNIYELDGLSEGPINRGSFSRGTNWIKIIKPLIENRVRLYQEYAIPCNVFMITSDKDVNNMAQVNDLEVYLNQKNSSCPDDYLNNLEYLCARIQNQTTIREQMKIESVRRKHDYLPFLTEVLKMVMYTGKNKSKRNKTELPSLLSSEDTTTTTTTTTTNNTTSADLTFSSTVADDDFMQSPPSAVGFMSPSSVDFMSSSPMSAADFITPVVSSVGDYNMQPMSSSDFIISSMAGDFMASIDYAPSSTYSSSAPLSTYVVPTLTGDVRVSSSVSAAAASDISMSMPSDLLQSPSRDFIPSPSTDFISSPSRDYISSISREFLSSSPSDFLALSSQNSPGDLLSSVPEQHLLSSASGGEDDLLSSAPEDDLLNAVCRDDLFASVYNDDLLLDVEVNADDNNFMSLPADFML